jgi:cell cycle sensor histidine kinase DivJ
LRNQGKAEAFVAAMWIERLRSARIGTRPLDPSQSAFVVTRLAVGACALLATLAYLAFSGAPPATRATLFLLTEAPLLSVIVLMCSGDLRNAQAASIVGWLVLAIGLEAMTDGLEMTAAVLFVVALIEAILTFDFRWIVGVSVGALGGLALHAARLWTTSSSAEASGLLIAAPLLIYVVALAAAAAAQHAAQARANRTPAHDLQMLISAMDDLVLRFDRSGAVLSIFGDKHMSYGLDARDLIGRGLFQRVHVADRPAFLKLIADAFDADSAVSAHLRIQMSATHTASGRFVEPYFASFDARVRHMATETEKEGPSVVCVLRDVTSARRTEEEAAAARQETAIAVESKTRFLANVSHELRTPLNAIIGFSEMLGNEALEPPDPAKRREYAKIISDSGHHLLEVVNTILDMSKIESGSMQVFPEPFVLPALVNQCCDMVQLRAEQSNIALLRDYHAGLDEVVADKRACKQILINLLSNALKFTPRGGRVKMRVRPEGNFVALSVIDSGVGIDAKDLERVGDPFFQASSAHDRAYEGTGLGLSVVRGLVGLHGGAIAIESAPRIGTTVTVRLPLDCRNQPLSTPAKIDVITRHGAIAHGPSADFERADQQKMVKKIA